MFDLEWENIQAGHSWLMAQADQGRTISQLLVDYPDAGAYILDLRQHPGEKIKWLEASMLLSFDILMSFEKCRF